MKIQNNKNNLKIYYFAKIDKLNLTANNKSKIEKLLIDSLKIMINNNL
jgi:hypothetical protein